MYFSNLIASFKTGSAFFVPGTKHYRDFDSSFESLSKKILTDFINHLIYFYN